MQQEASRKRKLTVLAAKHSSKRDGRHSSAPKSGESEGEPEPRQMLLDEGDALSDIILDEVSRSQSSMFDARKDTECTACN